MIDRALSDIRSGDESKYWRALAWLTGTERRGMSFALCCEFLEEAPDAYRRRLLQECGVIPKPMSVPSNPTSKPGVASPVGCIRHAAR